MSAELEKVRSAKADLLKNADLPLPDLSILDGELIYKGQKWDCMSSAEQLKVAAAIVRKLKPECGFILLDKLEQMDLDTLHEFGAWLEAEGLQAIATRVSTGEECSVIIEDGYAVVVTRWVVGPSRGDESPRTRGKNLWKLRVCLGVERCHSKLECERVQLLNVFVNIRFEVGYLILNDRAVAHLLQIVAENSLCLFVGPWENEYRLFQSAVCAGDLKELSD